jgi:hypothetical protein
MTPVFRATLVRAFHVRSFEIAPHPVAGWEVVEHEDQHLIGRYACTDWHRVERAVQRLAQQISDLQRDGWREVAV